MCERWLHYMAPFQNAASIRLTGLKSFNIVQAMNDGQELFVSIADPFVNNRRGWRHIDDEWMIDLHDYVPLYWATHTPMQYVVTMKNNRLEQEDLIFFLCWAPEILRLEGVYSTDGNAASNDTTFFEAAGAIPHLDWKIIANPRCWSYDYKWKKAAEVLVPDSVSSKLIKKVAVLNHRVRNELNDLSMELLKEWEQVRGESLSHWKRSMPPIEVRPEFYYSKVHR